MIPMEVHERFTGVLNINKPTGWTSHDVVLKIRQCIGEPKVGHAGTLDPLATGVLLLCIGKATKITQYLMPAEKEYVATLRLGVTTDTYDADGKVLERKIVKVSVDEVKDVLLSFTGEIEQIPPMYSAVKYGGKRLYEFARNGETVNRPSRRVTIFGIECLELRGNDLTLRIRCSKGTYIRSLAADIGGQLGCGAHIAALQRTRVGPFALDECISLEDVEYAMAHGFLQTHVVSMSNALNYLPKITVGGEERRRIEHGDSVLWEEGGLPNTWDNEHRTVRIVGCDNTLVGLGTIEASGTTSQWDVRPIRVLV